MSEKPSCSTCPFWAAPTSGERGECRVEPPAPGSSGMLGRLIRPASADYWCGRHPSFSGVGLIPGQMLESSSGQPMQVNVVIDPAEVTKLVVRELAAAIRESGPVNVRVEAPIEFVGPSPRPPADAPYAGNRKANRS